LTFKTAIDDPTRIAKSRDVGPLFGLTPGRYQSGETDIIGKITKVGDVMVRTALFEAANVMLTRSTQTSRLKAWAQDLAKRRGTKRAIVALARKLGVILHRIWVDGSRFRFAKEDAAVPALITANSACHSGRAVGRLRGQRNACGRCSHLNRRGSSRPLEACSLSPAAGTVDEMKPDNWLQPHCARQMGSLLPLTTSSGGQRADHGRKRVAGGETEMGD
jgi:hypothetical protein